MFAPDRRKLSPWKLAMFVWIRGRNCLASRHKFAREIRSSDSTKESRVAVSGARRVPSWRPQCGHVFSWKRRVRRKDALHQPSGGHYLIYWLHRSGQGTLGVVEHSNTISRFPLLSQVQCYLFAQLLLLDTFADVAGAVSVHCEAGFNGVGRQRSVYRVRLGQRGARRAGRDDLQVPRFRTGELSRCGTRHERAHFCRGSRQQVVSTSRLV